MNSATLIEQRIVESVVAEPSAIPNIGIDERVLRGVALLDSEVPGWAQRINLDRFDLADGTCCVLGQVYGPPEDLDRGCTGFAGGVEDLFGDRHSSMLCCDHAFVADSTTTWDELEQDWRIVIADRQASA